mmetsp:Transcript_31039/g.23081  ORF Transcript_31039/g.23081 Transcript_31039/m.23081 type:complete len:86 (-) Transcript_31039:636-893(-)
MGNYLLGQEYWHFMLPHKAPPQVKSSYRFEPSLLARSYSAEFQRQVYAKLLGELTARVGKPVFTKQKDVVYKSGRATYKYNRVGD